MAVVFELNCLTLDLFPSWGNAIPRVLPKPPVHLPSAFLVHQVCMNTQKQPPSVEGIRKEHLEGCYSKCGPETSSIYISWEIFFFFNANAWTPPIPTESESLGLGFRYLKKFSSDSYVLCSLKSTDPTGYMWDSVGTGHGDSGGVYTVDCTSVYAGRDCLFKRW